MARETLGLPDEYARKYKRQIAVYSRAEEFLGRDLAESSEYGFRQLFTGVLIGAGLDVLTSRILSVSTLFILLAPSLDKALDHMFQVLPDFPRLRRFMGRFRFLDRLYEIFPQRLKDSSEKKRYYP